MKQHEQVPEDLQDLDTLTPFAAILRYEAPPVTVSLERRKAREMVRRLREWAEPQVRREASS